MMDENEFWQLIENSRSAAGAECGDDGDSLLDNQTDHLRTALQEKGEHAILQFDARFQELMNRAYRWDLWGAAYWIGGGCSDDGFMDFRSTLISLGRERFERAVADPDVLAEIVDAPGVPFLQAEGFGYVAMKAFKSLTGRLIEKADWVAVPDFPKHPAEPAGESWDFDNREEIARRLPRLSKKLPDGGG